MSPVDRQERIVQLISGHATMSARAIGTELSIPRATVNYDLKKLVEGGRIERTTKEPQDKRAEYRVLSKSIPS
jgi:predicted ArsR family transcriptional regulator